MQINPEFFLIKISKELQAQKRKKMTISSVGYLGIKYAKQLTEKGVIIEGTQENSPARAAGFVNGDIITSINDTVVTSQDTMSAIVTKVPPKQTIKITYIPKLNSSTQSTKYVQLAERPLSLDIPTSSQDMRFNLQFGEVVMIGTNALKHFPPVEMGDTLIVHHTVEYKERAEGDMNWNDWHLMEDNEHFEYRYVQASKEVLGVWKIKETDLAKAIIPFPGYVFCHPNYTKSEWQKKNGVWLPDSWEKSMEEYNDQLDDLAARITELNALEVMKQKDSEANYKEKANIKATIDGINIERRNITRKMHQKHMVETKVIFVNPITNDQFLSDIQPGDTLVSDYFLLYPLDLFGTHYALVRPKFIDFIIKQ